MYTSDKNNKIHHIRGGGTQNTAISTTAILVAGETFYTSALAL